MRTRRAVAFVASAGVLSYLALEGGGYDLVVRQTVALAIWGTIALGFAFGVLPRSAPGRLALVPLLAAAGLLAWMVLSFAWSASDERTTAEIARFLCYAGIALLALIGLNRHTFVAAAAGVSVGAFAIAAIAVASRLFPDLFPEADQVGLLLATDRLSFPLDSWNAIGAWGAMCCAIGLAWSSHAKSATTRSIALAAVPVATLAVYLSYSRAGVVGCAVAVTAVLVLAKDRRTVAIHAIAAALGTGAVVATVRASPGVAEVAGAGGPWLVTLALVAAAVLCVLAVRAPSAQTIGLPALPARHRRRARVAGAVVFALLVAAAVVGPLANWASEFRASDEPTASDDPAARLADAGGNRNDIWASSLDAFGSEPLLGIGPGTFEFWWLRESGDPEFVRDAHSLYLEHAAELGLPGLALLLITFGGLAALALSARRRLDRADDVAANLACCAAFAVFAVSAGVDWLWEVPAATALGIGAISVAGAGGFPRRSRAHRRAPLYRPGGRVAIVVAALSAALVQVPGIVSAQRVQASVEARDQGDLPSARRLAAEAIDAQPWAARPRAQLALVEAEAGRPEIAEAEIRDAIEREPENWEWPLILALVQAGAGDRPTAIETFEEGRGLAPNLDFYSPFSLVGRQIFTDEQLQQMIESGEARGSP